MMSRQRCSAGLTRLSSAAWLVAVSVVSMTAVGCTTGSVPTVALPTTDRVALTAWEVLDA